MGDGTGEEGGEMEGMEVGRELGGNCGVLGSLAKSASISASMEAGTATSMGWRGWGNRSSGVWEMTGCNSEISASVACGVMTVSAIIIVEGYKKHNN